MYMVDYVRSIEGYMWITGRGNAMRPTAGLPRVLCPISWAFNALKIMFGLCCPSRVIVVVGCYLFHLGAPRSRGRLGGFYDHF